MNRCMCGRMILFWPRFLHQKFILLMGLTFLRFRPLNASGFQELLWMTTSTLNK
uniref:Putative UDP-3-O-3-hydroxymyristoyl N-acetylglucosamine deacetylase 2 n=1 Tax=Rhizophora mucronata TaxID=61149 RepID=A0A2P2K9L7_RHIMU